MSDQDYGQESTEDMLEHTREAPLTQAVGTTSLPEDNDRPAAPSAKVSGNQATGDLPSRDDINDLGEVYEEGEEGILYKPRVPSAQRRIL